MADVFRCGRDEGAAVSASCSGGWTLRVADMTWRWWERRKIRVRVLVV